MCTGILKYAPVDVNDKRVKLSSSKKCSKNTFCLNSHFSQSMRNRDQTSRLAGSLYAINVFHVHMPANNHIRQIGNSIKARKIAT